MAQTSPVLTQETCEHAKITSVRFSNIIPMDSVLAVDEEIPTIDFFMLFSDDPVQQSRALNHLSYACDEYGFFYLVNHGVPDSAIEGALEGIAEFFEVTKVEERKEYMKSNPTDRIMWGLNSHAGENREYLKVVAHPHEVLEEYFERFQDVKIGLARAISKILGFEECYTEKLFNLTSGFDVAAMNVYPPSFQSKGSIGVPSHTDPGFFVSLIQDVDGGLRVLSHKGKWINVHIPRNAFLIQIGDHLELKPNGKYKSHVHQVVVDNNKVKRISLATLHGPSLDTLVIPASEFVDQFHRLGYRGMTYKESLEANGHYEIEVQSCLEQLRL
ncbi:hypothetical protein SADUNF_Sadunf05G0134700 [Salix dunnii]|uniref:Fe2OG dioxygenase domain-containing protein n=1 Tax=Salix dunnii TaxID=1413687 RepID=A0A835N3P2_9ROSI|nr:hypothetical protein SADUNF_Sadunf05G0134700 [Salix dunnii]